VSFHSTQSFFSSITRSDRSRSRATRFGAAVAVGATVAAGAILGTGVATAAPVSCVSPPIEYEYEVPAPRTALSAVPKPVAFEVDRPPSATLTAVPLSAADEVATPAPVAFAPQLAVPFTWMSLADGGETQETGAAVATPVPRIAPAATVAPTATAAPNRVARERLRSERVVEEKKDWME
jgi:hypothetical protein